MRKVWKARFATLIDHFHLTPEQILTLTDRQILDLYFHPRAGDGSITQPATVTRGGTLMSELQAVDQLVSQHVLTKEKAEAMKEKIKEKMTKELNNGIPT